MQVQSTTKYPQVDYPQYNLLSRYMPNTDSDYLLWSFIKKRGKYFWLSWCGEKASCLRKRVKIILLNNLAVMPMNILLINISLTKQRGAVEVSEEEGSIMQLQVSHKTALKHVWISQLMDRCSTTLRSRIMITERQTYKQI